VVLLSGCGAGSPFPNYTAYASGKVAVARFAETVALEVAPHAIRVNCVGPGFVATRIHEQTLAAGDAAGAEYLQKTKDELARGGVPPAVAARAIVFLLGPASRGITGRFLAAPYDGWEQWRDHLDQIRGSDLFTLRRIVPRDRGMDWQ
jgi:NAD(P)-dependent dehydrogenase (short-subunit alcohol dehydrogenase family)